MPKQVKEVSRNTKLDLDIYSFILKKLRDRNIKNENFATNTSYGKVVFNKKVLSDYKKN